MRHGLRTLTAFAFCAATLAAGPAAAELRIDITRGVVEPLPIAINDFVGENEEENKVGRDISRVLSDDLERSGLFKPLDKRSFIQQASAIQLQPRFGDWRVIGAQALVHGVVKIKPDGRLRIEFRLWDVLAEQQMIGKAYDTPPENWRRVAHIIADAIYKRITGEDGYFDTRIVYVAESGPATQRIKRLAIMDQDGANHRFLTDGASLVLTPRFSPSTQEITYLSYVNDRPRVYLFNIETGRREVVGDFPGMTFAPRFSPDGNKVIMSLATERQFRDLHDGSAHPRRAAPDRQPGDRHLALLFARRHAHRLQLRSRRHPAALRHGRRTAAACSASASARAATRRRCGRRAAISSPSPRSWAASSPSASCAPTARASAS